MLIGIDGRALAGPMAGSGRYVSELCRVLDRALPEARFVVYSNRPVRLPVDGRRWCRRGDDSVWGKTLSPFSWYALRVGRLSAMDGITAFWGGANFLPLSLPRPIHAVLTVLDVVHRVMPESMGIKHRLAFGACFRAGIRRADILASISEGTAARLAAFGYRCADAIVRPGVDARFCSVSAATVTTVRRSLGISGPYLLSVATLEPRKNLATLIAAFAEMVRSGEAPGMTLVLAGHAGWRNGALLRAAEDAVETGVPIRLTGHVDDASLPALYAGAEVVVMPSIYEGFGLPILEARMCGARVVASDTPETREAGGVDVTYVLPTVDGIRAGIHQALRLPRPVRVADDRGFPRWSEEGLKLAALLASVPRPERSR